MPNELESAEKLDLKAPEGFAWKLVRITEESNFVEISETEISTMEMPVGFYFLVK